MEKTISPAKFTLSVDNSITNPVFFLNKNTKPSICPFLSPLPNLSLNSLTPQSCNSQCTHFSLLPMKIKNESGEMLENGKMFVRLTCGRGVDIPISDAAADQIPAPTMIVQK